MSKHHLRHNFVTTSQHTSSPIDMLGLEQADLAVLEEEKLNEQLRVGVEQLETLCATLEAHRERGDMTPREQAFAQLATESVFGFFGERDSVSNTVALEDGTVSMEVIDKVKDTLKKFWEAIKRVLLDMAQRVRELFDRIFSNIKKLEAHNEELLKKVNQLPKSAKPTQDKIKISGVQDIQYKNNTDMKSFITALQKAVVFGDALYKKFIPNVEEYYSYYASRVGDIQKDLRKHAKDLGVSGEDSDRTINAIQKIDDKYVAVLDDLFTGSSRIEFREPVLPGSWGVPDVITKISAGKISGSDLQLYRMYSKSSGGATTTTSTEIPTPTVDEMAQVLRLSKEIIKVTEDKKRVVEQLNEKREGAIKAADSLVDYLDKNQLSQLASKMGIRRAIRKSSTNAYNLTARYSVICFRAIKAHHAIINKALSHYGNPA